MKAEDIDRMFALIESQAVAQCGRSLALYDEWFDEGWPSMMSEWTWDQSSFRIHCQKMRISSDEIPEKLLEEYDYSTKDIELLLKSFEQEMLTNEIYEIVPFIQEFRRGLDERIKVLQWAVAKAKKAEMEIRHI